MFAVHACYIMLHIFRKHSSCELIWDQQLVEAGTKYFRINSIIVQAVSIFDASTGSPVLLNIIWR